MDDDDIQESGVLGEDGTTQQTTAQAHPASEEAPPPKPPRPMTEQQKNELMLKEAFPTVDGAVIKAVLSASRGRIESAFNALLGSSQLRLQRCVPANMPRRNVGPRRRQERASG